MTSFRSSAKKALALALVLPALTEAATYTMRISVPGLPAPAPPGPAYNKLIDPDKFAGYWTQAARIAEYSNFSDYINGINYRHQANAWKRF